MGPIPKRNLSNAGKTTLVSLDLTKVSVTVLATQDLTIAIETTFVAQDTVPASIPKNAYKGKQNKFGGNTHVKKQTSQ